MNKRILCYGDSNTYGFNPYDCSRYEENQRWSGILKQTLKDEYEVIEEGKNNRTGFVDNPDGFEYSSQRHFPKFISKIGQLDILVLAVGTNDMQFLFDVSFKNIERGLENLITEAKKHKIKNIILVPPVKIKDCVLTGPFSHQFNESSIKESKRVDRIYKKLARVLNCNYIDFNDIAEPSDIDGLHYEPSSHAIIAKELADFISAKSKVELINEY